MVEVYDPAKDAWSPAAFLPAPLAAYALAAAAAAGLAVREDAVGNIFARWESGDPAVMIGSDSFVISTQGPLAQGAPHPRTFGTFPRVIGQYVREKRILSLEEAVYKMTGLPAQKLRLADRGLIKEGYKADVVVFDPEAIGDRATYENPFQYPAGIDHVFCNGVAVLKGGQHTGLRPGQILTRI